MMAYETFRDTLCCDEPRPTLAHIRPQYDANGFGTGLWLVFNDKDEPICENIWLGQDGNAIVVGQFQGWDNESYDEDGYIAESEYVELGRLQWCQPLDYDEDAGRVLDLIVNRDNRFGDVEFID